MRKTALNIFWVLLLIPFLSFSQDYLISQGGTITTCSGTSSITDSFFQSAVQTKIYPTTLEEKERNRIKEIVSKYNYKLLDEYVENTDTVFVVSFWPKEKRIFKAMEGVLNISSDKYGVKNVIAKPVNPKGSMDIQINQKIQISLYQKIIQT